MRRMAAGLIAVSVVVSAVSLVASAAQRKQAAISSGWVRLPEAGARETEAYVTVDNPTAYDVSLQSPSSDAAATVEFRTAGKEGALPSVNVPAYESLEMTAKTTYIVLRGLKKPLAEGESVALSMTTESGGMLTVSATVKKQ